MKIFGIKEALVVVLSLMIALAVRLDDKFVKVPNRFPSSLSNCFIDQIKSQSRCACLYSCFNDDRCNLVCYADSTCRRYSARVTKFWNPDYVASNLDINRDLDGYQCHTSWVDHGEITNRIIKIIASPSPNNLFGFKENAVDGYYCNENYYHSARGDGKFYQVDFGTPINVSRVVIITRNYRNRPNHFSSIAVDVGNSSTSDKEKQRARLGFYNGPAENGEAVTFEKEAPINGRYITVKATKNNTFLLIGEIKICLASQININ